MSLEIFPVPISEISNDFICKTDLEKNENFMANIAISGIFESGNLHLEENKIPCVWVKVPVFFPDRDYFANFPVFPVQWAPCNMQPAEGNGY